ncbi:MAG: NUDIX domain-containing protein [Patescibacteria group bacterium]|nr:NUDIX domain-containing protein [Patescibacteria group bacterium]MDE2116770.1 NUDIX domain-containing protein [Patescibacteria group bacterium]
MTELPLSTVGYLIRGPRGREEIFLGTKAPTPKAIKRKIAGKLIGYGGDFDPGIDRSIAGCFARELAEESGFRIDPADAEVKACILIKDENGPRLTLCYIFVRKWTGDEAGESREMHSARWYPTDPLPDDILAADKIVLPRLLKGEKIAGWIEYDAHMNVIAYDISPVDSLDMSA